MVLLNQAREKISKLQHELDAAHKTIKDLQDKMNDRNAKIAQMAKGQIVQLTHHVTRRPATTGIFHDFQLFNIAVERYYRGDADIFSDRTYLHSDTAASLM